MLTNGGPERCIRKSITQQEVIYGTATKNDEGNKYYGFTYRKTYRNHSYLEKCRVSCGGLP